MKRVRIRCSGSSAHLRCCLPARAATRSARLRVLQASSASHTIHDLEDFMSFWVAGLRSMNICLIRCHRIAFDVSCLLLCITPVSIDFFFGELKTCFVKQEMRNSFSASSSCGVPSMRWSICSRRVASCLVAVTPAKLTTLSSAFACKLRT